jgi:hypothetical protein
MHRTTTRYEKDVPNTLIRNEAEYVIGNSLHSYADRV